MEMGEQGLKEMLGEPKVIGKACLEIRRKSVTLTWKSRLAYRMYSCGLVSSTRKIQYFNKNSRFCLYF